MIKGDRPLITCIRQPRHTTGAQERIARDAVGTERSGDKPGSRGKLSGRRHAPVLLIAVAKLTLHVAVNGRYGYFRDEFDYLACGDHLAWGYVDQPPIVPVLMKVTRLALGESLRSIRFLPALASSGALVVAATIARELGGRRFALLLTAVTVLIAPIYLSAGSLHTTNSYEPLLWMRCAYFAILAVKRNDPRYWLGFGVIAGVGLEEKYSIAIFCFAMVVGLLLTEQRRALWNRWMWFGGIAAFLIFLPNLLWNVAHHWPFLELMRNIKADGRDIELSPLQYFVQQILLPLLSQPANGTYASRATLRSSWSILG